MCDFYSSRATLCGDRRARGAKARGFFCDFCGARATLCGDRRGRGAKTNGFLRFLRCSRDPLRGSAWPRCKNPWFFLRFLRCPRDPLRGSAWSRCKNSRFFAELVLGSCLVVRAPAPGTGGSRVRFLPGPRAGVARCNLHFKATCAEQLAQSKLHRATCADQLAPTSLRRAPCLEQLAQSNLRRATYAEQLAQSNLHRAPCLVLSRACFTNASCREKERILQRWADLACDVLLSGQPWSSLFFWFSVSIGRILSCCLLLKKGHVYREVNLTRFAGHIVLSCKWRACVS